MPVFLILSLCSSASLLLLAALMQRAAFRQAKAGRKPLILLAGFVVSGLAALPVVALVYYVTGPQAAGLTVLGAGLWHFAAFKLASHSVQPTTNGASAETKSKA